MTSSQSSCDVDDGCRWNMWNTITHRAPVRQDGAPGAHCQQQRLQVEHAWYNSCRKTCPQRPRDAGNCDADNVFMWDAATGKCEAACYRDLGRLHSHTPGPMGVACGFDAAFIV